MRTRSAQGAPENASSKSLLRRRNSRHANVSARARERVAMQSAVEKSRRVCGGAGIRCSVLVVLCFAAASAVAQEGDLQSDFRRERKHVREACDTFGLKLVTGCAYTLFTDHPLHIAAGSMPPQNGFGVGGAFVAFKNTTNWRMSWHCEGVGAFSGAWRAGAYMKRVHTLHPAKARIKVTVPPPVETP